MTASGDAPADGPAAVPQAQPAPPTVRSESVPTTLAPVAGGAPGGSTVDAWVDVPVYQPDPGRRVRGGRRTALPVGLALDCLLGLVAGVLIILLR